MARADAAARRPFVGRWRITAMELWTAEDLDLLGAARLTLNRDGSGEMSVITVEAGLDYRVGRRFHFLGIEAWVARWCRANPELARRIGLLDDALQRRRAPRAREGRHGT